MKRGSEYEIGGYFDSGCLSVRRYGLWVFTSVREYGDNELTGIQAYLEELVPVLNHYESREKRIGKLLDEKGTPYRHVGDGKGWLLDSNDWLTSCCISGRVAQGDMDSAEAAGILVYSPLRHSATT